MQIPNPNQAQEFDHETADAQGNPVHGFRSVDGMEEIVDLRSGKSNMQYWKPETITFYENCDHIFRVTSMGLREIECKSCRLMTSFHPAVNFREDTTGAYILLNGKDFPII